MGLDFFAAGTKKPSIDLTDYKFVSDNHERTQNGQKSNANNKGAWRGIRIQSSDNLTFTVTMYNQTGNHPVWGDNIQMAPKQMRLIEENGEKIFLRGFGTDTMGASFADYGITLHKQNGSIERVTLHMFDRNIEIMYLKGNLADMNKSNEFSKSVEQPQSEQNFDAIFAFTKNFKQRWDSGEIDQFAQMMLVSQADNLNNKGTECYNNGDTDGALNYFSQALQFMPINDNALLNLAKSYTRRGDYTEAINSLRMLYYLHPTILNKSKSIAYSLLLQLIINFGSTGGTIAPSKLIDFIKNKFLFTTNDSEILKIVQTINETYNNAIIYALKNLPFMGPGIVYYATEEHCDLATIEKEIGVILNWNLNKIWKNIR